MPMTMERLEHLLRHLDDERKEPCRRLYSENWHLIEKAPGSRANHQAWPGGYLDHIEEVLAIAERAYSALPERGFPFTLGDAALVLLLHDIEKPWKYVAGKKFTSSEERHGFVLDLAAQYGIPLADDHLNGLKYVHGELGGTYSPTRRAQKPLAAFVHCCDVFSARVWYDEPRKNGLLE